MIPFIIYIVLVNLFFLLNAEIFFLHPTPQDSTLISNLSNGNIQIKYEVNCEECYSFFDFDGSLVAMYSFDNQVQHDSSINNLKTECNFPCPELVDNGLFGKSAYFDGNENCLFVKDIPGLGSNVTISFWLKIDGEKEDLDNSTSHDLYHNIITQWDHGGFLIRVDERRRLLFYTVDDDTSSFSYSSKNFKTIEYGVKYHIVYQIQEVSSTISKVIFYVNGTKINEATLSYHVGGTVDTKLFIGNSGINSFRGTKGLIDEILIFNRILTQKEVENLYVKKNSNNIVDISINNVRTNEDLMYRACIKTALDLECTERSLSDGIAPIISGVNYTQKKDEILFNWQTTQKTKSIVEIYQDDIILNGIKNIYTDEIFKFNHSILIRKLKRGKDYFFSIRSPDISKQESAPVNGNFYVETNFNILIPTPQIYEETLDVIKIDNNWELFCEKPSICEKTLTFFQEKFKKELNLEILINKNKNVKFNKKIVLGDRSFAHRNKVNFPKYLLGQNEGYTVTITSDRVFIIGISEVALFRGFQTIFQLIRHDGELPISKIIDWPTHKFRGAFINDFDLYVDNLEYVDYLASLKLNALTVTFTSTTTKPLEYIDIRKKIKKYFDDRHIEFIPMTKSIRRVSDSLPFDLYEGKWIRDEEFSFNSSNYAVPTIPFSNILSNANFETGVSNYGGNVISTNCAVGSYCLSINAGTSFKFSYYNFTVGDTYTFSAKVKSITGVPVLTFLFKDFNGDTNGAQWVYDSNIPKPSNWKTYTCSLVVPEGTNYIFVALTVLKGIGEAHFDDVKFYRINSGLLNVLRGENTDVTITNQLKTVTFKNGVDFIVVNGDTNKVFDLNLKPFQIQRIESGNIQAQETVLVSYDTFINHKSISCCVQTAVAISDERVFTDIYYKNFDNIFDYDFNPNYIHLQQDELRGFNRDSRNIKTGLTSEELFANFLNRINDYVSIEKKSPHTKFILWADMFNPHHNSYESYQNNYGGSKTTLHKIIENNMIDNSKFQFNSWWYFKTFTDKIYNSIQFFTNNKFKFYGSPAISDFVDFDLENTIIDWSEMLVDNPYSDGVLHAYFHEFSDPIKPQELIDKGYEILAETMWNTKFKLIKFESFEFYEQKNNFFQNWKLSNNTQNQTFFYENFLRCNSGQQFGKEINNLPICALCINDNYQIFTKIDNVKENKRYKFSVWIKSMESKFNASSPLIKIESYDKHERIIESFKWNNFTNIETSYNYYTLEILIKENIKFLQIILNGDKTNKNQEFCFDVLKFYEEYNEKPNYFDSELIVIFSIVIILGVILFLIAISIFIIIFFFTFKKQQKGREDKGDSILLKTLTE